MGYKVHSVDGKGGEVDLGHLRTGTVGLPIVAAPANGTYVLWRAPVACTITAVRAYRAGGSGGTVNVKNGTSDVLAAALNTTTDAWASTTTVQNAAVAAGGSVSAVVASLAGTPTALTVQIDYTVSVPA